MARHAETTAAESGRVGRVLSSATVVLVLMIGCSSTTSKPPPHQQVSCTVMGVAGTCDTACTPLPTYDHGPCAVDPNATGQCAVTFEYEDGVYGCCSTVHAGGAPLATFVECASPPTS